MKKMVTIGIVLVLAALVAATPTLAFEGSADAYVGVYSKYLWRGFDLSEDDDYVIQPGVDVSAGNFTMSFWGNISENTGEMNEVDLTLDYSTSLTDLISISVGNIMYNVDTNDESANTTNEVYVGVALDTILEPALTVYYDYDEFDKSIYATVGVSHGIDLSDALSLSLGLTGSYVSVDDESLEDESWAHNVELSAGADYAVNDSITISGSVLYSEPLSDEAEDNAGIDDEFTGGVSVSYAF